MIIKKFQGKTKEEALESAKKELGEGIVGFGFLHLQQFVHVCFGAR